MVKTKKKNKRGINLKSIIGSSRMIRNSNKIGRKAMNYRDVLQIKKKLTSDYIQLSKKLNDELQKNDYLKIFSDLVIANLFNLLKDFKKFLDNLTSNYRQLSEMSEISHIYKLINSILSLNEKNIQENKQYLQTLNITLNTKLNQDEIWEKLLKLGWKYLKISKKYVSPVNIEYNENLYNTKQDIIDIIPDEFDRIPNDITFIRIEFLSYSSNGLFVFIDEYSEKFNNFFVELKNIITKKLRIPAEEIKISFKYPEQIGKLGENEPIIITLNVKITGKGSWQIANYIINEKKIISKIIFEIFNDSYALKDINFLNIDNLYLSGYYINNLMEDNTKTYCNYCRESSNNLKSKISHEFECNQINNYLMEGHILELSKMIYIDETIKNIKSDNRFLFIKNKELQNLFMNNFYPDLIEINHLYNKIKILIRKSLKNQLDIFKSLMIKLIDQLIAIERSSESNLNEMLRRKLTDLFYKHNYLEEWKDNPLYKYLTMTDDYKNNRNSKILLQQLFYNLEENIYLNLNESQILLIFNDLFIDRVIQAIIIENILKKHTIPVGWGKEKTTGIGGFREKGYINILTNAKIKFLNSEKNNNKNILKILNKGNLDLNIADQETIIKKWNIEKQYTDHIIDSQMEEIHGFDLENKIDYYKSIFLNMQTPQKSLENHFDFKNQVKIHKEQKKNTKKTTDDIYLPPQTIPLTRQPSAPVVRPRIYPVEIPENFSL